MDNSLPENRKNLYSIGYQCIVDSFAIGGGSISDKADLYKNAVYDHKSQLLNWSDEYDRYCYGYSFYGGDLPGVSNAINNYLADLGINMLYMTPVFAAESNHKYDTVNYKEIDKQFGTLDDFKRVVNTCHNHDMKLILDGVFNHTSSLHEWYKKAKQGIKPYSDYYKKNKEGYFLTWAGVNNLPLLNHEHPDVKRLLYQGHDSVVAHWLSLGADGWRLDVAEGLGKDVIRDIKAAMSTQFKDKLLCGEVVDTYGKDWIGDDLLDGVMNYVFLGTTVNFLTGKITGEEYLHDLTRMYNEYPRQQLYTSWNIISTHDTNRMLQEVDGNENLFKMAVSLQFTYPGIPMIYYGDEIGLLPGQKEINNRSGMDWDRVDLLKLKAREPWKHTLAMDWQKVNQYTSYHFFYKHLIWLKKQYPVLTEGEFIPLFANDTIIAYLRRLEDKLAFVLINRGETQNVSIPIPKEIKKINPVLNGVHGPLPNLDLAHDHVQMNVYSQNSYIFVS